MISNISNSMIKAGLAFSLGALIYNNINKLSIASMKSAIFTFVQEQSLQYKKKYVMAKKIILISSQESESDIDQSILSKFPNHQIPLTELGNHNAVNIGSRIKKYLTLSEIKNKKSIQLSAYCSPYLRAQQTLKQIKNSIKYELIAVEDLNLRDQDLGNLPKNITSNEVQKDIQKVNPFYYRYQDGESQADVYLRTNNFTNTLIREISNFDRNLKYETHEKVIIVVAHPIIVSQIEQALQRFDQENQVLTIKTYFQ